MLVALVGCPGSNDKAAGQAERIHKPSLALAARTESSMPVLRVHLGEVQQVRITCREEKVDLWHMATGKAICSLEEDRVYTVYRENGLWRVDGDTSVETIFKNTPLAGSIELRPQGGHPLAVIQDKTCSYPGLMRLIERDDNRFALVNVVDVETYLDGVVGAEMYSHWHKAALRAQSIACRTYALYQKAIYGSNRPWDIGSDQMSQMYLGLNRRHRRVSHAVEDTRGIVLAFGPENQEKIFPAYYSAVCGGHTENAAFVFNHSLDPLSGCPCPYCISVARPEYYRWPAVKLNKKFVQGRLTQRYPQIESLEGIQEVQVVAESSYGRAQRIRLVGLNGRKISLRAEDFRLTVSTASQPLRSSWYTLYDGGGDLIFKDGKGWGHGVGMCQCGAEQMASLGKDCIQILQYYYPKAIRVRAY